MKNTLKDLNNYLFEQIEKLNDEDLTGEQLDNEIRRAEAITDISEQIIKTGDLQLKAMKHMDEYGYSHTKTAPILLGINDGGDSD